MPQLEMRWATAGSSLQTMFGGFVDHNPVASPEWLRVHIQPIVVQAAEL